MTFDPQKYREEQEALKRQGSSFAKPPGTFRILPAIGTMKDPNVTIDKWWIGPRGKGSKSFRTRRLWQNWDVVELVQHELRRFAMNDAVCADFLQQIEKKPTHFMNVIDRADESRGPLVWEAGKQQRQEVLSLVIDPEYGEVWNAESGTDVIVEKASETPVRWRVRGKRQSQPLHTDPTVAATWLAEAKDLERYLREPESDEAILEALAPMLERLRQLGSSIDQDILRAKANAATQVDRAAPAPPPGAALPPGWTSAEDPASGRTYYISPTGASQWEKP